MTKKITYENLKERTFVIICGFGPEKKNICGIYFLNVNLEIWKQRFLNGNGKFTDSGNYGQDFFITK